MKQHQLKNKVISGFFWVGTAHIAQRAVTFTSSIILARLLDPKDFGIVAIAITVISFTGILGGLGIKDALIYQKNKIQEAANTAFFLNISLGAIYTVVTFFAAPLLAEFFDEPAAKEIIQALSLIFILHYAGATSMIMLQKEIQFTKKSIILIAASTTAIITSIILAYNGFGPWSLVIGNITSTALSSLFYIIFCTWKPTLKLDKQTAIDTFNYSKHILKTDIFIVLIEQGDKLVLSKIKNAQILGFYTQAYNLATVPVQSIATLIQEVSFPAFSKIKENKKLLIDAYYKNLHLVNVLAAPASIGFILLADPIIFHIYGEKWLPAATSLQIIAFYGYFRSLSWVSHDIIKITGNPKSLSRILFIQTALMIMLIWPLTTKYSLEGAAMALAAPSIIQTAVSLIKTAKILDQKFSKTIKIIATNTIPTLTLIITTLTSKNLITISGIPTLISVIAISAASYIATLLLVDRYILQEIKSFIQTIMLKKNT